MHSITPITPDQLVELGFRHSHWKNHRDRVARALLRVTDNNERCKRFHRCGTNAWILKSTDDSGALRVAADYCHDRFCSPCQRTRAQVIAANLNDHLKNKTIRMITLTVATDDMSLVDSLKLLYGSFKALRRTKLWKKHVYGGVGILEVKRSAKLPRWHPHLHVLCEGTYLEQGHLTHVWKNITKTSFIVDICFVKSPEHAAHYVTKYLTKPTALRFTNHEELLDETIVALQGRRSVLPFGTWHGIKFTVKPPEGDWEPVAPLSEVLDRAAQLDPWAIKILAVLERNRRCHTGQESHSRGPPESDSTTNHSAQSVDDPLTQKRGQPSQATLFAIA